MSQTFEFYEQRASEAAAEANEASLILVKERALRAEAVWRGLANQAKRVAKDREKAQADRQAKRELDEAEGA